MNNEHEMVEVEVITLTMDDGTDQDFMIYDEFECENNKYLVVVSIDEEDNLGTEYFLLMDNEAEDAYESIEDSEEYEKILNCYLNLREEMLLKGEL